MLTNVARQDIARGWVGGRELVRGSRVGQRINRSRTIGTFPLIHEDRALTGQMESAQARAQDSTRNFTQYVFAIGDPQSKAPHVPTYRGTSSHQQDLTHVTEHNASTEPIEISDRTREAYSSRTYKRGGEKRSVPNNPPLKLEHLHLSI